MNISPNSVRSDDDNLWVSLSDGRTIATPLAWFPRLREAAPAQRLQFELSQHGLHWDALDEDVSVEGLLIRQAGVTRRGVQQPA